jgi:DNA-binding transcriptional LysR family regulator
MSEGLGPMTFEDLRVFIVVCQTGSLSAAARALGCSQSAVSHHVRRLEAEYAEVLLDRHRSGVTTTRAGQAVLSGAEEALRALSEAREAVRSLGGERTDVLRIGTVAGGTCAFLIDTVAQLRSELPSSAAIELVTRARARESFEDVRRGHVAMLYTGLGPPMQGLEQCPTARSRWVLLRRKEDASPHDAEPSAEWLASCKEVLVTPTVTAAMVRREFSRYGLNVDRLDVVDDRDNAIRLVERGGSQVLMPSFWAPVVPETLRKICVRWMQPLSCGWIVRRWANLPPLAAELAVRYRATLKSELQDPHVDLIDEVA